MQVRATRAEPDGPPPDACPGPTSAVTDIKVLLDRLAGALGDAVVLWRGPELTGSDVDLLVTEGADEALVSFLHAAGLRPRPGDPGHTMWTGPGTPLDVMSARRWPARYPSLEGLLARADREPSGPPVASPEDRLLILAADAVAGRPIEKIVRRSSSLLAEPGTAERLRAVATRERLVELALLIEDPGALEQAAERGRLPYRRTLAPALRSAAARRALMTRISVKLGRLGRRQPALRHVPRPPLVTISGMDGAGKSTAAVAAAAGLESSGLPTEIVWARLGSEGEVLNRLARPVKRLLRRQGTTADPVAAGGPSIEKVRDPREAAGRRRLLSWAWIVLVAWINARSYRQGATRRHRGVGVVCDRWATDALVDLRLRYGRHALAEAILRRLPPRPDLAILLTIDADTAAARKPDDQARWVLAEMESRYAEIARRDEMVVVDAHGSSAEVEQAVLRLVDGMLATRR